MLVPKFYWNRRPQWLYWTWRQWDGMAVPCKWAVHGFTNLACQGNSEKLAYIVWVDQTDFASFPTFGRVQSKERWRVSLFGYSCLLWSTELKWCLKTQLNIISGIVTWLCVKILAHDDLHIFYKWAEPPDTRVFLSWTCEPWHSLPFPQSIKLRFNYTTWQMYVLGICIRLVGGDFWVPSAEGEFLAHRKRQ